MSTTFIDGGGAVHVRLNYGATTSGDFLIKDDNGGLQCLRVADTGVVTFYNDLQRFGAFSLDNVHAGPGPSTSLVKLKRSGSDIFEFSYDSDNNIAKLKSSSSGWALRLEGDTVDLSAVNSNGVVRFRGNAGAEYLQASMSSANTTTTVKAVGDGQKLLLNGYEVRFDTPNASSPAVLNRFMWATTERLNLQYDADSGAPVPDPKVTFEDPGAGNSASSIWHSAGLNIVALIGNSDAAVQDRGFEVRAGSAQKLQFRVKDDGEATFWTLDGASSVPMASISRIVSGAVVDGLFEVGITPYLRGHVKVHREASAPGIIELTGAIGRQYDWYADGQLRGHGSDPEEDDTAGFAVGAKQRVIAWDEDYAVLPSECDAIFTNDGATDPVTFTLPEAEVGLRYMFVVAANFEVTVQSTASEPIYMDGVSNTSYASTNHQYDFISVSLL